MFNRRGDRRPPWHKRRSCVVLCACVLLPATCVALFIASQWVRVSASGGPLGACEIHNGRIIYYPVFDPGIEGYEPAGTQWGIDFDEVPEGSSAGLLRQCLDCWDRQTDGEYSELHASIVPLPYVVGGAAIPGGVLALRRWFESRRRSARRRRGACEGCGYPLTDLRPVPCPECGVRTSNA